MYEHAIVDGIHFYDIGIGGDGLRGPTRGEPDYVREFLADASAVQFTRNPQGLRDALVLVGAAPGGSRLSTDEAHEAAHMLFAAGVQNLFATHPPMEKRIARLDAMVGRM